MVEVFAALRLFRNGQPQPLKFCHAREALEPVAAGASSEGKDPLTG